MFDGDGYGVALSVAPLDSDLSDGWPVPDGVAVRPSRLTEVLPPGARSRAGKAMELGRIERQIAQLTA